ncbi:hypothetical protein PS682_05659 [Pseudomonas fluorescens]|nr:hypothetical protein PS682_05659 [Pseudomonas fluorescens]
MHTLGQHAFDATAVVELLAGLGQCGVFCLIGQQVALLVHHGDLRFAQFRHTGGDQVDDRQHLPRFQGAASEQFDQHRGARLALIAHKHRAFRDGQVHAGTLDVVQAGDGARQFAFQATTVAGGFHELAGTQALVLVEDFKTDVAVGRGHASGGELHARTGHIVGLDQQGPGVGLHGVGDVGGGQGFHDLLGVHARQAAVKRPVIGLLRPQHHGKTNRHAGSQADHQAYLTQHGHFGKVFQERQAKQRRLAVCLGGCVVHDCFCHDLNLVLKPASA